jgi:hypothetical protein
MSSSRTVAGTGDAVGVKVGVVAMFSPVPIKVTTLLAGRLYVKTPPETGASAC